MCNWLALSSAKEKTSNSEAQAILKPVIQSKNQMPVTKSIAAKRTEKVEDKAAAKKAVGKKKKIDSEDEAYVGAKGAKEKKEKDPDAPKKPQTAYFIYMNANRNDVKAANPDLAFGPLT